MTEERECWNCKQCVIEHNVFICLKQGRQINEDARLSCFEKGVTFGNEDKIKQIESKCESVLDLVEKANHNFNKEFFIGQIEDIHKICRR